MILQHVDGIDAQQSQALIELPGEILGLSECVTTGRGELGRYDIAISGHPLECSAQQFLAAPVSG